MAYISFQPNDYFNTLLHTGNDASPRSLTGVGFQPDFVWLKRRNSASSHTLYDAVRTAGSAKGLASNANAIEGLSSTEGTTANYGYVNSFDSDGFSVTTGASNDNYVNNSGDTYVSWNWKANGQGSSNTDGSITSTVSANTTAGFSIVKWTGTSTNGSIGHSLGVVPKMIIVKRISGGTGFWMVYHSALGNNNEIYLNATNASSSSSAWQNTDPTSSVFYVSGAGNDTNGSGDYIAYCFSERKGFSKFSSFVGNGSADGSFIYTGFSPAFVMTKRTDTTSAWDMFDNKREGYNPDNDALFANLTNAEDATDRMDLVSNGFKMRINGGSPNYSGGSYIYLAFAESPIVSSNGVPAVAR